jgi:hypothetical protein
MSSVLRSYSQIDARSKYFIALNTTTYYRPEEDYTFPAIMPELDFSEHTSIGIPGVLSSIYRDMGRQITTTDANNRYVATYRLVQRQLGATTEGVPSDYEYDTFYIRVWGSDAGTYPVTVARLG